MLSLLLFTLIKIKASYPSSTLMKNDIDDITKQKESLLTFTFDQENDKLLIKAQSEKTLYCGFLEPNPLITFDKIKKVISAKNYEIVSINNREMEITIGGMVDLILKSQDQLNLEFLKDTIQKLTDKFQKEVQRNIKLESIIENMQNDIISIKNIQEQQKMAQQQKNITFQSKFGEVKAQFHSYNNTQKQSIEQIKQEIIQLREEIKKQKEIISDNSQKITLNHQEIKKMIAKNSEKIDQLKTEQNEIKNGFEVKQGENDQQATSVHLMINNIKQEMKKTQEQIENLKNQLKSNDQKQSQSNTQLRNLIQTNEREQQKKNNTNSQQIDQNSAELIKRIQLHDELKNQVVQLKNQSVENKNKLDSIDQEKTQKITNLTTQLTQLSTKFDSLITQTIPICLPYKPDFLKQSKVVITHEEKLIILQFFKNKKMKCTKLLYRASKNEFCVKKFHENCDGIANTLIVILTGFNKKIGGFTPLKWKSTQSDEWSTDNQKESFIFSLTHNDKFTLQQPEKAIKNRKKLGPRFGDGPELTVYEKPYQYQSIAQICVSYHNQKYKKGDKASWQRFHGGATDRTNFEKVELQVWGLQFV